MINALLYEFFIVKIINALLYEYSIVQRVAVGSIQITVNITDVTGTDFN